jgi:hypothetical protein
LCLWCQWLWPLLYSALKRSKKEVRECNPSLLLWFFFCSSVNEWLRCENIHIYSHNFFTTKAMFHFWHKSRSYIIFCEVIFFIYDWTIIFKDSIFLILNEQRIPFTCYSGNLSLLTFLRGRLRHF